MVAIVTRGNIGVQENNQSMFREALLTVPIKVKFAELSFLAAGIPKLLGRGFNENEYLEGCKAQGIMPFSQIKLRYDQSCKALIPETSFHEPFLSIYKDSSERIRESAFEGFLSGGKTHLIGAEMNGDHFEYEDFQRRFLKRILQAGYDINEVDLCFDYIRGNDFVSDHRLSGLRIGWKYEHPEGIELQLANHPKEDEVGEVVKWFRQLAGKHNAQIYED